MSPRIKKLTPIMLRLGTYAKKHFTLLQKHQISNKSRYERVTTVDTAIHKQLKKILPSIAPYPVLSEENVHHKRSASYWVIDPLDGTTNYILRIPFWSIGIGLVEHGNIALNMIYQPMLQELFFAEKNAGAWLNKKRLKKDSPLPLSKSIIGMCYSHTKFSIEKAGSIGIALRPHVHNMRHTGSTLLTMAYVAAGRLEAQVIVGPVTPWDTLPGILLISEIGGTITDFTGAPWTSRSRHIIASNGTDHARIQRLISSALK